MRHYLDTGLRAFLGLCLTGAVGACMAVTPPGPAGAQVPPNASSAAQGVRGVVVLRCDAAPSVCRDMVRALAEVGPAHTYRINPDPAPPRAFVLDLAFGADGSAILRWPDGTRQIVPRNGQDNAEFMRFILSAAPEAQKKALRTVAP